MTRLQAQARIERAKGAVEAVVKLHRRLRLWKFFINFYFRSLTF
jgi:hypothetical protein